MSGAPQDLTASEGSISGDVDLSWQPLDGATEYEVWRDQAGRIGHASYVETTPTPLFTDSNVAAGMAYTYWVRALNGQAAGALSAAVVGFAACKTDQSTALSAPGTVISGASYEVVWASTASATGYVVEEAADPWFNSPSRVQVADTTATFEHTVSAVQVFYYRVTPVVACGSSTVDGDHSNVATTTVVASQLAPAPALLRRSKP